MPRTSLSAFIREHRADLQAAIRRAVPNIGPISDREIRLWVLNDEGLYLWARREGVDV